jgi:hypothetical protein
MLPSPTAKPIIEGSASVSEVVREQQEDDGDKMVIAVDDVAVLSVAGTRSEESPFPLTSKNVVIPNAKNGVTAGGLASASAYGSNNNGILEDISMTIGSMGTWTAKEIEVFVREAKR